VRQWRRRRVAARWWLCNRLDSFIVLLLRLLLLLLRLVRGRVGLRFEDSPFARPLRRIRHVCC
jgi:hypothetical protein